MVLVRRQEQRDQRTPNVMLVVLRAVLLWAVLLMVKAAVS